MDYDDFAILSFAEVTLFGKKSTLPKGRVLNMFAV